MRQSDVIGVIAIFLGLIGVSVQSKDFLLLAIVFAIVRLPST